MSYGETYLLASERNRYDGCWATEALPHDSELFKACLEYSIKYWRRDGIKVVWLTICPTKTHLIPCAQSYGFTFHHVAHHNEQALVLVKRLVGGSLIPDFAHHTIGVGGIVTTNDNRVLTIVEKHDMQERPGHLKFPGGCLDPKEFLVDGVRREVYEETNIQSTFLGIVGFRHYHQGQFGTSNIYFVCHLRAESYEIQACETEIGYAQWMDIDDYLACETVMLINKEMLRRALKKTYLKTPTDPTLINSIADGIEIYY